ncbi:unnamed protein product [Caenorhabditis angaria]|uniref:Uncharacterized protein n=1 Tax=Caenorhabditis angaria TaxID=860376 RepID=A0A9P1I5Q2_9PELO|nr:unnamed protein product [Caenorhabditis angaria]
MEDIENSEQKEEIENENENEDEIQKTNKTDEGPGKEYEIYLKSEDFVDKLKLLHYEKSFLKMGIAYKPIQRHYFVKSTNVGEQFFLFTSIAAWLIRKCGDENYPMPQEFDDPNSTISNIVTAAKSKVFIYFTR